jgi:uncharacterized tellurite resistance protein B-like protein
MLEAKPLGTLASQTIIADIMAKLDLPNGFSKLNSGHRKFLLAAIIGSVIPADGKIRDVEMKRLGEHLHYKYRLSEDALKLGVTYANSGLDPKALQKISKLLPELLSIEDRISLIGHLWDVALCDHELHSSEEKLIYVIADNAEVPRKRVIEQQSRAQSHNQ